MADLRAGGVGGRPGERHFACVEEAPHQKFPTASTKPKLAEGTIEESKSQGLGVLAFRSAGSVPPVVASRGVHVDTALRLTPASCSQTRTS